MRYKIFLSSILCVNVRSDRNFGRNRVTTQAPYFLRQSFLGNIPSMEISASDYEGIVHARGILNAALTIEEKYDLVLGNFIDFEREILLLTMDQLTDHSFDYNKAYNILSTLNRRIANFIYIGKSYTELISSMASKCVSDKELVTSKVKKLTNKLSDENIEYRFAEALRGHIMHCADAVHNVSTPSKWSMKDGKKGDTLTFNLDVFSINERLRENSSFKKAILNELGEKIDLKKIARKYMGCISELQVEIRKLISGSVNDSRHLIQQFNERYAEFNDGDSFGLAAYSAAAIEVGSKPISISLEWDDTRMKLQEKNNLISNMDKRCITTAITGSQ